MTKSFRWQDFMANGANMSRQIKFTNNNNAQHFDLIIWDNNGAIVQIQFKFKIQIQNETSTTSIITWDHHNWNLLSVVSKPLEILVAF